MTSKKRSRSETAPPVPRRGSLIPPLFPDNDADKSLTNTELWLVHDPRVSDSPQSGHDSRPFHWVLLAAILSRGAWGTYFSLFFHLALCIGLATLVFHSSHPGAGGEALDVGFSVDPGNLDLVEIEGTQLEVLDSPEPSLIPSPADVSGPDETMTMVASLPAPSLDGVLPAVPDLMREVQPTQNESRGSSLFEDKPILGRSGTTKSRTSEARHRGLPGREGDTTDKSEQAVEDGLAWLARHQLPDGSWAFDLSARDENDRVGNCQGQCSNTVATSVPGNHMRNLHPSRMAATAIALLPFLGAGYSHTGEVEGNVYRRTVARGLEFLKYHAISTRNGTDFRSGLDGQGMYIQGIVTLTLCEAFEMTGDETLKPYAQGGLEYIEWAQKEDGGWRYHVPDDTDVFKEVSGDTSVSGWQMMALKSGISAGLTVRPQTIYNVEHFLNLVQDEDGALYQYLPQRVESGIYHMWGTTAVGLLMRQYLGWQSDTKGMKKGLKHVLEWINAADRDWQLVRKKVYQDEGRTLVRPLEGNQDNILVHNLYFTYNAALVLNNFGGNDWHRTFKKIRDFLIATQWNEGHMAGSWLFYDQYLNDGGRLLNTALSVLILETPYRYLPMYQEK